MKKPGGMKRKPDETEGECETLDNIKEHAVWG